ncbi:MAG: 3-hydroxyacyl-CoA dehydrogenase family protein, partial [Phycisphaerae bacterium]
MTDTKCIAVIGAGTMGRGIAQVFAQSGYDVVLHDAARNVLDDAQTHIGRMLGRAVEKGKMSAGDADAAKRRIRPVADVGELGKVSLIVEAATERVDVKIEILKHVESALADDGILATNTSSISITQLAAVTDRPDVFIGMHFFNPVPLMKLVEVVRGLRTSDDTVARTMAVAEAVGKTPVSCHDHPGFVSNRILMPMINEAVACLQDGVAEPDAIDT